MKYILKEVYKVSYCSLEYPGESILNMYVLAKSIKEALEESKKAFPTFIKNEGHDKDGDWVSVGVEFMFEIITEKSK